MGDPISDGVKVRPRGETESQKRKKGAGAAWQQIATAKTEKKDFEKRLIEEIMLR